MKRTLALVTTLAIVSVAVPAAAQTGTGGTDPTMEPSPSNTATTGTETAPGETATAMTSGADETGTLPETAGPWPAMAVAGLASLAGGAVLLKRRRR